VSPILVLACAALLSGTACVDLTRPASDAGAGPLDAGGEAGPGIRDGGEEAPSSSDGPQEAGVDAETDVPWVSTLAVGLVGYWKLDERSGTTIAADSSGLGNTGSITGSPARLSSGLPKLSFSDPGALSFAAQDDAVAVPDAASLRPTEISIAAWVKLASLSSSATCGAASPDMQYIVHRRNTRGAVGMFEGVALIKEAAGTYALLLSTADGQQDTARSTTQATTGTWVHLVGTFDGQSRIQLFVNGVLEGTAPHGAAIAYDPTRPLFLARTGECGGPGEATWDASLNGALDDVRVYDRVLSDKEVAMLARGSD
jgi:large repetitive protein